jgi:hypothetical protein
MHNWNYSRDKLLPETASPSDLVEYTLEEAFEILINCKNAFYFFFTKI